MRFTLDNDKKNECRSILEQRLQFITGVKYAYTMIDKKNILHISCITNYHDEWVKIYSDNQFQCIDPVIMMALGRSSPFTWDERSSFSPDTKADKVFSLAKDYNIANGYTFVLHDYTDNLVTLSLVINEDSNKELEEVINNNKAKLQLSLIEIHEKILTINHENNNRNYLKSTLLTLREHDILYWCSMGKTYEEIAMILGISLRTVKFHMANVTRKLNVANARQAIRLSTELGLIKNKSTIVK